MLKRKIIALFLTLVIPTSLLSTAFATQNEQDALIELEKSDVPIELIDLEKNPNEASFCTYDVQNVENSDAERVIDVPLDIELDENGKIKSIVPNSNQELHYELFILENDDLLMHYSNSLASDFIENSGLKEDVVLAENVKYFISIVITNDKIIESYDGYFSISGGTIEYEYLFYNSAEIAALNGIPISRATQNEIEPNDIYQKATAIGDKNNVYGKIATEGDRDWYSIRFSKDGDATFSLTNIPSGKDYNMSIYYAPNSYTQPLLKYQCTHTSSANEMFQMSVETSGIYYMEVYSVRGFDTRLNYCLKVANSPSADQYETNDTIATATQISTGKTYYATIHKAKDVDYYKLNCSAGILNVVLSSIPVRTNYDLELYDSNNRRIESSTKSGTSDEKITYSVKSSGTYYIKVYSASGINKISKYALKTELRPNSLNLTFSVNPKLPLNASTSNALATPIKDLPVEIYTVNVNGTKSLVGSGKTNTSGNYTLSGINIAVNITELLAKVTFENNNLKIQGVSSSKVYSFEYHIPIGNTQNVSFALADVKISEDEILAYGTWKNGQDCLLKHQRISSVDLGKLVLKSQVSGVTQKTVCVESGGQYIQLMGGSDERDYLDQDIILHEMGHLMMLKMNTKPNGAGGKHTYSEYCNDATAYSEGWADFYSCAARNSSQMIDYRATGKGGCDLSNASYLSSGTWKNLPLHGNFYDMNRQNELNVASIFWPYKGMKSYNATESLVRPRKNSMAEIYKVAINNAQKYEKEKIWGLFDNRGCAYDMDLPTANLSISGTTASVTANDNIAVKKIEWYVNGKPAGHKLNVSSDTLDLSKYVGTLSVEARVYDPEGLAAEPRPREKRFASVTKPAYVPNSVNVVEEIPMTMLPVTTQNEVNELLNSEITLSLGDCIRHSFHTNGFEDVMVFAHILGGIDKITFISPDGLVYDTIDYISPDAPYMIEDAQPGDWIIEVSALSEHEALDILSNTQNTEVSIAGINGSNIHNQQYTKDDLKTAFVTPVRVSVVSKPTKVICPKTIYSNDPQILMKELSSQKYVTVYCDGQQLDYSQALPDGDYVLDIIREIDGRCSDTTYVKMRIDTMAPQLSFNNEFETKEEGIYLDVSCSPDTFEVWIDGEYIYMSDNYGSSSFGIFIELIPGEQKKVIEVYDICGNKTVEELVLHRYEN